jgi:hypothetical protein
VRPALGVQRLGRLPGLALGLLQRRVQPVDLGEHLVARRLDGLPCLGQDLALAFELLLSPFQAAPQTWGMAPSTGSGSGGRASTRLVSFCAFHCASNGVMVFGDPVPSLVRTPTTVGVWPSPSRASAASKTCSRVTPGRGIVVSGCLTPG